jgi:hypothetical protein
LLYLTHQPPIVQALQGLGYPVYLLNLLGTAKIIGVISLLQTRFGTLKEWAYAGFFINLTDASWSHLASGQPITAPFILFLILLGSYLLWKQMKADGSKEYTTGKSIQPVMQYLR